MENGENGWIEWPYATVLHCSIDVPRGHPRRLQGPDAVREVSGTHAHGLGPSGCQGRTALCLWKDIAPRGWVSAKTRRAYIGATVSSTARIHHYAHA